MVSALTAVRISVDLDPVEHPGRCGIAVPPNRDEVSKDTFAPAAAHLDALAAEGAKVARWSALTSSANNPT
jgi:hypothetical protein